MKQNPLISVIVPVYNTSEYLRKCLDSICGQTYRNLEIICVDDGSTDNSAQILQEYASKDPRVKIIIQKNAGPSAARNAALDIAAGEWITGVDSDDYLEKDTCEYIVSHIHPEDDIIIFEVIEEDPWAVKLCENYCKEYGAFKPTRNLIMENEVIFCNKWWRKSLIEKNLVRFPVGLKYEDAYFWYVLAPYAQQVRILPEAKYHYVRRSNSIMSQTEKGCLFALDHIYIAEKVLEFYKAHPLSYDMRNLGVEVLFRYFSIAEFFLPSSQYDCLVQQTHKIVCRQSWCPHLASVLAFVRPLKKWERYFVTHRKGKTSYGIGPIKLLTMNYREGVKIWRFCGIKVRKQRLNLVSFN